MSDFKIWMNGRLVPQDQATLPVNSTAVFYATNVFEGLRAGKIEVPQRRRCSVHIRECGRNDGKRYVAHIIGAVTVAVGGENFNARLGGGSVRRHPRECARVCESQRKWPVTSTVVEREIQIYRRHTVAEFGAHIGGFDTHLVHTCPRLQLGGLPIDRNLQVRSVHVYVAARIAITGDERSRWLERVPGLDEIQRSRR